NPREQVPQRERVARARLVQDRRERCAARVRVPIEVNGLERASKNIRSVFEVGSTWAKRWSRFTRSAGRHHRFTVLQLQRYPTRRHTQQARPLLVNFERVSTTEISSHRGRRVDEEQPGRRPDVRAHLSARELKTMLGRL